MKFHDLPDDAIVRLPVVQLLFSISAPTVWRWSKSGQLPKPIRISGITGWQVGDLRKTLSKISLNSQQNNQIRVKSSGVNK